MNARLVAFALAGTALLSGCATMRDRIPGQELVGQTLRMVTTRNQITHLTFRRDGTVTAAFQGGAIDGRWQTTDNDICFVWTGAPRECWPYTAPFRRGQTRTVTSDRGNVLRVTLL